MASYEEILKMWHSFSIQKPEHLELYLHNFRILFAYNSGRIENEKITYYDTYDIFNKGTVSSFSGDPHVLFEQHNQKNCYEFLKNKIIDKEPLTIGLVKEIHEILTSGTYDEKRFIINKECHGQFKKHDYIVGINEVGSLTDDVEHELLDLIDEINSYFGKNILKVAAYFHAKFEYIHPFADGNGRVGRTLMNYSLMIQNHSPIIIYDEYKKTIMKP